MNKHILLWEFDSLNFYKSKVFLILLIFNIFFFLFFQYGVNYNTDLITITDPQLVPTEFSFFDWYIIASQINNEFLITTCTAILIANAFLINSFTQKMLFIELFSFKTTTSYIINKLLSIAFACFITYIVVVIIEITSYITIFDGSVDFSLDVLKLFMYNYLYLIFTTSLYIIIALLFNKIVGIASVVILPVISTFLVNVTLLEHVLVSNYFSTVFQPFSTPSDFITYVVRLALIIICLIICIFMLSKKLNYKS